MTMSIIGARRASQRTTLLGVRMVTKLKRTFIKSENVRKGKRNKL
jgi:hypothetical protein